jgi:hypothetical protein
VASFAAAGPRVAEGVVPGRTQVYRCEVCREAIGPRVAAVRVVVEWRKVVFPFRKEVNRFWSGGREHWSDDPGGEGLQVAREITACPECAPGVHSCESRVSAPGSRGSS